MSTFNDNILFYIRANIYSFLLALQTHYLGRGERVFYDLNLVTNPFSIENTPIKEMYSENEYGIFCDYVNRIKTHKLKSILDIEHLLEGNKSSYRKYASTWLYVLLHLNNKWRRFEVTLFPRFNHINNLNILKMCNYDLRKALSYLKENNLDEEDIQYVGNKMKAFLSIHNKTKKHRDFTWTETTALALATAVILCEIRCELLDNTQVYLIDFDNKKRELPTGSERSFFNSLEESKSLKFNSLKMNRTLSSLSYNASLDLG
jgi:hypothetical protein